MTTLNSLPGISHLPLSQDELSKIHAYWRAANYLSVGQIYLYANPLLREPLKLEHIKTSPSAHRRFLHGCHYGFDLAQRQVTRAIWY